MFRCMLISTASEEVQKRCCLCLQREAAHVLPSWGGMVLLGASKNFSSSVWQQLQPFRRFVWRFLAQGSLLYPGGKLRLLAVDIRSKLIFIALSKVLLSCIVKLLVKPSDSAQEGSGGRSGRSSTGFDFFFEALRVREGTEIQFNF